MLTVRSDGRSLFEACHNEDGAFIRGISKTNKLILAFVDTTYDIVVDKLGIYMKGQRVYSCRFSVGLPSAEKLNKMKSIAFPAPFRAGKAV